jgi:hypothetical protein
MKNDSIIQSTCKRTTLANILVWLESNGERINSISELIRTSLEILDEQIRRSGFSHVVNVDDAINILDGLKGNLNPSKRGSKNLYLNLVDLTSIKSVKKISSLTNEDIEKAIRKNLDGKVKK